MLRCDDVGASTAADFDRSERVAFARISALSIWDAVPWSNVKNFVDTLPKALDTMTALAPSPLHKFDARPAGSTVVPLRTVRRSYDANLLAHRPNDGQPSHVTGTAWPPIRYDYERVVSPSRDGRFVNALYGCIEQGVEFRVAELGHQPFDQRSRKARHDAMIFSQPVIGFLSRITPR